jgi:hypothetical protein
MSAVQWTSRGRLCSVSFRIDQSALVVRLAMHISLNTSEFPYSLLVSAGRLKPDCQSTTNGAVKQTKQKTEQQYTVLRWHSGKCRGEQWADSGTKTFVAACFPPRTRPAEVHQKNWVMLSPLSSQF